LRLFYPWRPVLEVQAMTDTATKILTDTDSRSYQLIWRENKPTLKAVEN